MAQGQLGEVDGQWELSGPLEAVARATPRTLCQIVEKQVDRLSADQQPMLAVAGVAGAEFSAAVAIAGGINSVLRCSGSGAFTISGGRYRSRATWAHAC